jgi:hypothetical protein
LGSGESPRSLYKNAWLLKQHTRQLHSTPVVLYCTQNGRGREEEVQWRIVFYFMILIAKAARPAWLLYALAISVLQCEGELLPLDRPWLSFLQYPDHNFWKPSHLAK